MSGHQTIDTSPTCETACKLRPQVCSCYLNGLAMHKEGHKRNMDVDVLLHILQQNAQLHLLSIAEAALWDHNQIQMAAVKS